MPPTIGPNFNARSTRHFKREGSEVPEDAVSDVVTEEPAEPQSTPEVGSESPAEAVVEPEVVEPEVVEPEVVEPEVVTIPDGMSKVVDLQGWVGSDKEKAQAVLDGEASKPEAERRKTLISKMQSIVSADGSDLI